MDSAEVLFSQTRQEILSLILLNPAKLFHQREISRLTNKGNGAVQRELGKLKKAGYIRSKRKANKLYFQANQDHIAYTALRDYICRTVGPVGLIHKALKPFSPSIRIALIYGSIAAYNAQESSDVDLLIVGDVTYLELAKRLRKVQSQMNREINTSIFDPKDFASRYDNNGGFIADIISGHKMYVIGDEIELKAVVQQRLVA